MIIINEDNSHFFTTRDPEQMNLAGLVAFVDQYAGTAVTHLFLSPNSMRASFRSTTREAIWDPVDGAEPMGRWPQNAKRLHASGIDPYAVWISRSRERGLSPWLSMRMNDVHNVDDPGNYMHASFWREHPEFWRVPGGSATPWVNRAMNYVHPAVWEHQMGFVRELLERYDPDGLELDWMRFGHHLTPGREHEEGVVLTRFMRDVRALTREWAARRRHPMALGVRAPAHPDAAAGLGMDAVRWAREGLVDLIVPCPFWTTSDLDIPVELWLERLGDAGGRVAIAPGLEYNLRPWPEAPAVAADLAAARGFAASAYHRGAEHLYLFNWMDDQTRPVSEVDYAELLRLGLPKQRIPGQSRRHPVCFRDTVPAGFPAGVQLPVEAREGGTFRLPAGPRPERGEAWAIVGLAARDGLRDAAFEAYLNRHPLVAANDLSDVSRLGGGTVRAVRFACPHEAIVPGRNELSIRQVAGPVAQQIVWVELRFDE